SRSARCRPAEPPDGEPLMAEATRMQVTRVTRWACISLCVTAIDVAGRPALAQQPPAPDAAQIQQLQKRIDELEQQMKELQAQAAAEDKRKADEAAAAAVAGQPTEATHDMLAPVGLGNLKIRGFNDINFRAFRDGDIVNTFTIGQVDL